MSRVRSADGHRNGGGPLVVAAFPAFALIAGLTILLWRNPGLRQELGLAWELLVAGDPEPLRAWLLDFGAWAPVVSALLQVATSLIPPLPSFLVGIANAMLYGAVLGGLLTFGTALLAAAACFGLARAVGRPGVERIVSESSLARVDGFMQRRGVLAVFLGRLIPFINPDVVSYAAGVTKIGWGRFLVAIAAGSVPATVFYSLIGALALESTLWVTVVVAAATVLPAALLWILRDRLFPRKDGESDVQDSGDA